MQFRGAGRRIIDVQGHRIGAIAAPATGATTALRAPIKEHSNSMATGVTAIVRGRPRACARRRGVGIVPANAGCPGRCDPASNRARHPPRSQAFRGQRVTAFLRLCSIIDALNQRVGRAVSWLILAMTVVSAANAVSRKAFNASSNAFLEVQWYLVAAVLPARGRLHAPAQRSRPHRRACPRVSRLARGSGSSSSAALLCSSSRSR